MPAVMRLRPQFLVVRSKRFRVWRCCEWHRLSVQIGRFIWRWDA